MADAYRDSLLSCPVCTRVMEARSVSQAMVDVCPQCKGVWIDWFDGELAQVAKEVAPLSMPTANVPDPARAPCPHCQRPMIFLPHMGGGPMLWRCGECAGAFVPRSSFEWLAELAGAPEVGPEAPSALARLWHVLRELLKV